MDIIVTTPKKEMASAAREAADCIRAGGGEYFRWFPMSCAPSVKPGDRMYYVEDGFVRGFAVVSRCGLSLANQCATTGRVWPPGYYVVMDATSWRWIRPIPMRGFQGLRYVKWGGGDDPRNNIALGTGGFTGPIEIVGGWRDPKPEVSRA